MSIQFDPETRLFLLQLHSSFYAVRVMPDGQLMHVGSGPIPPEMPSDNWISRLDDYEEPTYVWDTQAARLELPAFGDVNYHDVALKVAFPELGQPLKPGEAAHLPIRDLRLRYDSYEIRSDASPGLSPSHGRLPHKRDPRQTLCVHMKDAIYHGFRATLCYRITPEHDVIERWIELENQTKMDVPIEMLAFGTVHVPNGHYELTSFSGGWSREFNPVRHPLEQGRFVLDQRGMNTGHASNPFFLLNQSGRATEDAGDVYFGALAYSGNWSLRFDVLTTLAVRVHGGYEPNDFGLTLSPGQSHKTPAFVHGCCSEGIGGASRRLHRFVREYVLPDPMDRPRPIIYNSWEATNFDLKVEHQIELARKAAAIGVELFCLDDGWFGGRRHRQAGLGDWIVSRDVFPDGMKPLIDAVRNLGMKFGLWFEPEMINPDSDLFRAHPDWVLHFPGRERTGPNQLLLDFGRPEAIDYVFRSIETILRENKIDFIKWDMNGYATEPGSVEGKGIWRKHVEGLYEIMDHLRREHPQLDIESCSGGGGRVDIGMLARADQVWTSDNTDAFDRTVIQDGFSLAYPPRTMECWVTAGSNPLTGRLASLDLRFDVAMRGALGIGEALDKISDDELESCRRKITFYKRIRPIVQSGDLYRLSASPEGAGVSIWQTVLPDASSAVYSIVVTQHLQGIHRAPSRLKGLSAAATYAVIDEHQKELGRYSGAQLMTLGLPGDTVFGGWKCAIRSRTLLLERVT